ncbi:MAG TPA: hypothetical protein VF929_10410 [Gemmatimonadaceae bacterium]
MSARRAATALAYGVLSLVAAPCVVGGQTPTVRIDAPQDAPFPAAPEITVRAESLPPNITLPRIRLRLALDAGIGLVVYDSTIAGDVARFTTRRLLPENRDIFAEASVLDNSGQQQVTAHQLAGRTGPRLQLVQPNGRTGVVILTRQPTFSWRSAQVTAPPGPWIYELFITNVSTQETRSRTRITDSIYTIPDTLQANTSYRWKVVARLANGFAGDSAVAVSQSSFVIAPSDAPVATLLYQNFPNPFPAASSSTTCIWFDLQLNSDVELTILDLRGNRVRTLIPGQLPTKLASGRYGRLNQLDGGGCDPRLIWDGTADNGRGVPAGVYLVRFRTNTSAESVKKILYLGR